MIPDSVSRFGLITEGELDQDPSQVDWRLLSSNRNLKWTHELIDKYFDRWDLCSISANPALPWDEGLLQAYTWHRAGISSNTGLPWSIALIEKYQDQWNWKKLSSNPALPWNKQLLERFADKWHWYYLSRNPSLPWSEAFIEQNKDKLSKSQLSGNPGLPWDNGLIADFIDYSNIFENPAITWSADYLRSCPDDICWDSLSRNKGQKFTIELIEEFKDEWNWSYLSTNEALPWSNEFLYDYVHFMDQEAAEENEAIFNLLFSELKALQPYTVENSPKINVSGIY